MQKFKAIQKATAFMLSVVILSSNFCSVFANQEIINAEDKNSKEVTWDMFASNTADKDNSSSKSMIKISAENLKKFQFKDPYTNNIITYYDADEQIDKIFCEIIGDFNPIKIRYVIKYEGLPISSGKLTPSKKTVITDFNLMDGTNTLCIKATDSNNNTIESSIDIHNGHEYDFELIFDENDDDKDGLVNYMEDIVGTDVDNPDTDGDGLSDYVEWFLTITDPLKKDSEDDGILDGDRDYDENGLSNIEEVKLGTDPSDSDSDNDDLNDYDEVNIYKTNPTLYDTDGDYISDSAEIKLGLNPLTKYSDGVTKDSSRIFKQTLSKSRIDPSLYGEYAVLIPSLSGKVPMLLDDYAYLSHSYDYTSDVNPAVVEGSIELETRYKNADLWLSFKYSKNVSPDKRVDLKNLLICEYKDGTLHPLDTTLKGDIISAPVRKSGVFVVIDVDLFLKNLGIDVESMTSSK